jgi:uncharacterized membrane protein
MLKLILLLVIGSSMVYLSHNNLSQVTLHLGTYELPGVPLFYVIIGSILLGLGFSYLIYLINSVFTGFALRGKDSKIKKGKNEIDDLKRQIQKLEVENEKLKNDAELQKRPTD